jgi:hypothetical protein
MRVEASNSKLRPKSPIHNGGLMVSSDLTFLTIGVKILTLHAWNQLIMLSDTFGDHLTTGCFIDKWPSLRIALSRPSWVQVYSLICSIGKHRKGVKILTLSLGHYVGTNLFRISYFIIITLVQRGRGAKVQNWHQQNILIQSLTLINSKQLLNLALVEDCGGI